MIPYVPGKQKQRGGQRTTLMGWLAPSTARQHQTGGEREAPRRRDKAVFYIASPIQRVDDKLRYHTVYASQKLLKQAFTIKRSFLLIESYDACVLSHELDCRGLHGRRIGT